MVEPHRLSRASSYIAYFVLTALGAGCGQGPRDLREHPASTQAQLGRAAMGEPKTLTIGFPGFPASPQEKIFVAEGPTGSGLRRWIFMSYLTGLDKTDTPHPILAEAIPSQEDRTWIINPDGTMETLWKIRSTAKWHDGVPITAKDFVFALKVYLDPEVPAKFTNVEATISRIDVLDDLRMSIKWKGPYFQANSLGGGTLPPLPAHLLEHVYTTDKQAFLNLRYWTSEYVGSGPFKVEQWDPAGEQLVAAAHDGFAPGRPHIDRIRFAVITDKQALVTQLMAGTIELVMGGGLTVEGAQILREKWESEGRGRVGISAGTYRYVGFQARDVPNAQVAVRDRRVRKALAHGADREGIASLLPGLTLAANFPISLNDPFYPAVDRVAPKYPHDPATANRYLDEAGYGRAADGLRRNLAGDPIDIPIWAGDTDSGRYATIVADNWRSLGLDSAPFIIPRGRRGDSEFEASFPAAYLANAVPTYTELWWTSKHIASPANRWTGRNRGGYSNPSVDALVERILVTVNAKEREGHVVELMRTWMDDVAIIPLLYQPLMIAAASNVGGYDVEISAAQAAHTWNMHKWTKE